MVDAEGGGESGKVDDLTPSLPVRDVAGDEGFAAGSKKRGWASPVAKQGAEHWVYMQFKSPKEVFQVRISTAEAEKDRVRDLVIEIPLN